MKIYTILAFKEFDEKYGISDSGRCFGYFTEFEEAEHRVLNNVTDLHECIYEYAVIEEVDEGLYPCATNRWFYKFNADTDKYTPIDEPKCVKHYINFAIG